MLTSSETMMGLAATTTIWSLFVPSLTDVKGMELGEFRTHEFMAGAGILAIGFTLAIMSKDSSVLGVTVAALVGLIGVYEWKIWSRKPAV